MKSALKNMLLCQPRLLNTIRRVQFAAQGRARDKHCIVHRFAAVGKKRGHVLVSLINDQFLRPKGEPINHDHTHHWENVFIVDTWRDLGFDVDLVRWTNLHFIPDRPYDVCIDTRANLERFSEYLPDTCRKVMHIDSAHWKFHNEAQMHRLDALEARRGVRLQPGKILKANKGIEVADTATMLGNAMTAETYAFADTPIIRTPLSTTDLWDWPEEKDWETARRRFMWFGSSALVHKGLDVVLEAFAQMPDLHLTVCGPVKDEADFDTEYKKELYDTPNITTLDWVDIHSDAWRELARNTGSVIYPSCSEGGGGSVITCMHAGMLPVVTRTASVDIEDFGLEIAGDAVADTMAAAQQTAALSAADIEARARAGWEFARAHHTREHFAESYRAAAAQILNA